MKKRRTVKKKKMSTGAKIAIGVVVAGSAYAAWEFLIKPMIEKPKDEKPEDKPVTGNEYYQQQQQLQNVVDNVQQIPANQAPKNRLSPIGTPFSKIDYNAAVFFGNKGAEVAFIQTAYNNGVRWLNAKNKSGELTMQRTPLKVDGIFGQNTYKGLKSVFTPSQLSAGITPKIALDWSKKVEQEFSQNIVGNALGGIFVNP